MITGEQIEHGDQFGDQKSPCEEKTWNIKESNSRLLNLEDQRERDHIIY